MSSGDAPAVSPLKSSVSILAPGVVRRFAVAMGLSASVLAAAVLLLYVQDIRHQREAIAGEGRHVIALKRSFLSQEFKAVGSDLHYLAGQELLRRFLSADETARAALEADYVRFVQVKTVYDQVRCLGLSGQERIRINFRDVGAEIVPFEQLQSKAARYYFEEGVKLEPGQVFVSPFDLNVEHGQIQEPLNPVVRFLTPVCDLSGRKQGILVLNYLGARLLAKLKEIGSGFRSENMLVNGEGEYLQAPDSSSEWGWLRGHDRSFRADYPLVWKLCQDLESGQLHVGDDLFTIERVFPDRHVGAIGGDSTGGGSVSLLLVSRVSAISRRAYSSAVLRQLLVICGGTLLLIAVISLYWARSAATREIQDRRLAESERRLRILSRRLLAAQEDERRSLSRQLHDELGQIVTAIGLDLKSVTHHAGGDPSSSRLARAVEGIDELLRIIHEIATNIRPCVLDDLGLQDAIESFISDYEQKTGIAVGCDLRLHGRSIPATIGENVYRVLQEALSNVAKHAGSRDADVSVEADEARLIMTVEDRGVGFHPEASQTSRLGILGMRERVELLDGDFELTSAPGAGTRIRVVLPLRDAEG